MKNIYNQIFTKWIFLAIIFISIGCTDPVQPQFQYKEGLVYIEALASTTAGTSYATILQSAIEFGFYKNLIIETANVSFINTGTGAEVSLFFDGEQYLPPNGFVIKLGETWEMRAIMPDGRKFLSSPETAINPVEIGALEATYSPQLFYSAEMEREVPGHSISVSFKDPAEQENYYYWRSRTYEKLVYCKVCYNGYFREGICKFFPPLPPEEIVRPYYTYACESDCWQVRYGNDIRIFADAFSNGKEVKALPISEVPLYTKKDILVELQQFSLSRPAYEYYKTLKDLIDNNSGFNAPLPAILVGNLYNPEDGEEFVLGRFTVAATTTRQLLIQRNGIVEFPLEPVIVGIAEGFGEPTPAPQVFSAPCEENRYRTGIRPEGWVD